jgi:hypothetical protein
MHEVKIRFNTNYPKKSDKKWRLIINDVQHLVDEIEVNTICYTSEDMVKGDDGNDIVKYHISVKAKDVKFETIENKLIATVI